MALTAPARLAERAPLAMAQRRDDWWVKPALTVLGLLTFVVYATWRAFENRFFEHHNYLSPFYSPLLPIDLVLPLPTGPWEVPKSLYILIFPLFFRASCYYYRQAYYRSFFADPAGCAVKEPAFRTRYNGERGFPWKFWNYHRYALYFALLFLVFLGYDAIHAFFFFDGFHVNIGSLVLLANWLLLSGYTFGCHSFRHLVGGKLDCFSCPAAAGDPEGALRTRDRYTWWHWSTILNDRHMMWAWLSLFGVILTDFYIRQVAAGAITDLRLF